MAEELRAVEIPQDDVEYVLVDERDGSRKFIGGTHAGDTWNLPPYQRIEPADPEDQMEVSPTPPPEADPNGLAAHMPGSKLDGGKLEPELIQRGFSMALAEVAAVATFGANKYTRDGWRTVPDGVRRYTNAMYRHLAAEHRGEDIDPETNLLHAAHTAWNALARLELLLNEDLGHALAEHEEVP